MRLTGLLIGQTLHTRPEEIYRALVEATAFGALTIINRFEEYGVSIKQIINCGGISEKNAMIMQIYADVVGQPLSITREPEASLLGSAIVAAVGAGLYPDLQTAARQMVSIERAYIPDAHRHDEYAFFVRQYQDTYQQLRELMRRMNERSSKK